MRTTLDIEDDILVAAKELARHGKSTVGQVLSQLARQALTQPAQPTTLTSPPSNFGFRPFAPRGTLVTNELIDTLREAEGV